MQANAAGFGSIKELDKYSTVKLQLMMKMKEVWHEWDKDNNNGRR